MNKFSSKGFSIKRDKAISFVKFDILDDEGIINACTGKWVIDQGRKEIFSFSKKQAPGLLEHNMNILKECLNIEPEIVAACYQVHSKDAIILENELNDHNESLIIFDSKDAMITQKKNIMLLITTADCVPIFVFDWKKKVIADIHAGWRGTHENILGHTIDLLKAKYNSNPKETIICSGPSIGQCCFEVGNHVASLFKNDYGSRYLKFNTKSSKNHVDLKAVNRDIALSCGIPKENIYICNICTCCNEEFFSYRRDGNLGLSANIVILQHNR